MKKTIFTAAAALGAVALLGSPMAVAGAQAATPAPSMIAPQAKSAPYKFKNCTALNKVYKHGVGRSNAKDKTSGKRVTNFKHSTSLYKKIVAYRSGLDRDKDGIACEKH